MRDREKSRASKTAWRLNHPEKVKAHHATYRARHREQRNASNAAYRAAHPEKFAEWQVAHADERKAYLAEWAKENPEKVRTSIHRHRARRMGAPVNDFTAEQWKSLQIAYDHCCAYCGERMEGSLTIDHVIPLSKGGAHTVANIVPACWPCNKRKGRRKDVIPSPPPFGLKE